MECSLTWCWNLDTSESRSDLESFEMWCWRKMEKISWTDYVRNEEELQRGKEVKNILQTIKKGKVNWIGHIFCRNCLLKHIFEGKIQGRIEVMGRWGRRYKQLMDDCKEKIGYWKLRQEAIDHPLWRTSFGRTIGTHNRMMIIFYSYLSGDLVFALLSIY